MSLRIFVVFYIFYLFKAECSFFKKQDIINSQNAIFRSCGTEEDNRLRMNIRTYKYNRTHTGTDMNITLYELFDETYTLEIELKIWSDGGWKNNFFHYKRADACNTLYLVMGSVWSDIIQAAKANQGCPVKPGFYEFFALYIDTSKIPFASMPGRYLFHGNVTKNNVPQLCLEVETELKRGFH